MHTVQYTLTFFLTNARMDKEPTPGQLKKFVKKNWAIPMFPKERLDGVKHVEQIDDFTFEFETSSNRKKIEKVFFNVGDMLAVYWKWKGESSFAYHIPRSDSEWGVFWFESIVIDDEEIVNPIFKDKKKMASFLKMISYEDFEDV